MKTTDPAEVMVGAILAMKPESSSPRKTGAGRRKAPVGISSLPIEWMDPMSWRLPSGKALAEFALQAGFLAPLILSGPRVSKKVAKASTDGNPARGGVTAVNQVVNQEVPEQSGTFRGAQ
jgi:hypothetical protein